MGYTVDKSRIKINKLKTFSGMALPFLLIAFYLTIEISTIKLPGPASDEIFPIRAIIPIASDIRSGTEIKLHWPLMIEPQHGGVEMYFILPFFLIFGINIVTLRLFPLFLHAFTLLFIYRFAYIFFNRNTARFALLLAVFNPAYIMFGKHIIWFGSIMQFFTICGLYCLYRWYISSRNSYLYLSFFLFGLGLSTRIWFLWILFSLTVLFIINLALIRRKGLINSRSMFTAVLSFLSGSILILIYNLTNNFDTIFYLWEHILSPDTNNLHYFANLLISIKNFFNILNSTTIQAIHNQSYLPDRIFPVIFIFALIMPLICIFNKKLLNCRKAFLLQFIIIMTLLISPITPTQRPWNHFLILYPLIFVLCGYFFSLIYSAVFPGRKAKIVISILITLFLAYELKLIYLNTSLLMRTGGNTSQNSALYKMGEYIASRNNTVFILGFLHQLELQTYNNSDRIVILTDRDDNYIREKLKRSLDNNSAKTYVFDYFWDSVENQSDYYSYFKDLLKGRKDKAADEKYFFTRKGETVYTAITVYPL